MAHAHSLEAKLEDAIAKVLREEQLFMYTAIINRVAAQAAANAAADISRRRQMKDGVRSLDFLDLPPEIRNHIYEYAVHPRHHWYGIEAILICERRNSERATPPPITRVSRQLRKETLGMFYRDNFFIVNLCESDPMRIAANDFPAHRWLSAIGSGNAAMVGKIKIRYRDRALRKGRTSIEKVMARSMLRLVPGKAEMSGKSVHGGRLA